MSAMRQDVTIDQDRVLRRSPRKKPQTAQVEQRDHYESIQSDEIARRESKPQRPNTRPPTRPRKASTARVERRLALSEISLPQSEDIAEIETTISSAQRARSSLQPSELDSVLGSFSALRLASRTTIEGDSRTNSRASPTKSKSKPTSQYASRYVVGEANCIDDYSDDREDDDEDTDLSGFVVDDDAELSYHDSSSAEDEETRSSPPTRKLRRRLQRGHRRVVDSDSDKENDSNANIADALTGLDINSRRKDVNRKTTTEVIDLTSSPPNNSLAKFTTSSVCLNDPFASHSQHLSTSEENTTSKLPSLFDSMLRLSPPKSSLPSRIETPELSELHDHDHVDAPVAEPPQTPTRTPSPPRLKSPSKLLSPSKHSNITRSPHRQSTDAFWDLHTINDWHDINSPKKAPTASPHKNPLARFAIWSDDTASTSDDETSSLPSPCASPTKPKSTSPMKSPEKAAQAARLAEKRSATARRKAFNSIKHTLAINLLAYLDQTVTAYKLSTMSASTGGVEIIWSKHLRSTAGRANWRRSVTRLETGSPVKGSPVKGQVAGVGAVKVEHFASIELAEKVIDSEDRLVNTLAHEFCHLANFMVSGVRDRPHGKEFMGWAAKAQKALREAEEGLVEGWRESWGLCKITTKHSYEIEWKYLWVCQGREMTEAMGFLGVVAERGCGAEYGRHSKSIDVVKQRCGRCKGRLVQVRPVPRRGGGGRKVGGSGSEKGSEASGSGRSSEGSVKGKLRGMVDVIELID